MFFVRGLTCCFGGASAQIAVLGMQVSATFIILEARSSADNSRILGRCPCSRNAVNQSWHNPKSDCYVDADRIGQLFAPYYYTLLSGSNRAVHAFSVRRTITADSPIHNLITESILTVIV